MTTLVMAMWLIEVVALAPCQCFTPGGVQITSPGLISRFGLPSSCIHPIPDMTIRIWPPGCVCHAERAPGSNVTMLPFEDVCWFAPKNGFTIAVPVKFAAGPLAEGHDPFGEICMDSAQAGAAPRRASDAAAAMMDFISVSLVASH